MTMTTLETVAAYCDELEAHEDSAQKPAPRLHRRSKHRYSKRPRKASLSVNGRNRSRSVIRTMR